MFFIKTWRIPDPHIPSDPDRIHGAYIAAEKTDIKIQYYYGIQMCYGAEEKIFSIAAGKKNIISRLDWSIKQQDIYTEKEIEEFKIIRDMVVLDESIITCKYIEPKEPNLKSWQMELF